MVRVTLGSRIEYGWASSDCGCFPCCELCVVKWLNAWGNKCGHNVPGANQFVGGWRGLSPAR